jgi:hypothetical protein
MLKSLLYYRRISQYTPFLYLLFTPQNPYLAYYSYVIPEMTAQENIYHLLNPKALDSCAAGGLERANTYSVKKIYTTGFEGTFMVTCIRSHQTAKGTRQTGCSDVHLFYYRKNRNVGFPRLLRRVRRLACWICGSEPRCDKLSNSSSRRA